MAKMNNTERAKVAAAARWKDHEAKPRVTMTERECPHCGTVAPMRRNATSCGAPECRLAARAAWARARMARLSAERH